MSALAPALASELAGDRAMVALFLRLTLPTHTIRWIVGGVGTLSWGGNNWSDQDATYGVVDAVAPIEDGSGDDAPSFSFVVLPPNLSAAAALCAPENQGSELICWLVGIYQGGLNVIPDPYVLYAGAIDQPTLKVDRGRFEIDITGSSQFDLLLEDDEGARLSDAFHQSIFPGETGFANVTGIENDIYWGMAAPPGSQTISPGIGGNLIGGGLIGRGVQGRVLS